MTIGPQARLGLVGPNGVGKTTLLRILAGLEEPSAGSVVREPAVLTVGYLEQDRSTTRAETLLECFARRTGVAAAERELEDAAKALARGEEAGDRYAAALERFLALGGGNLDVRARTVCAELRLPVQLERTVTTLSGGELARMALASILLSRFDLLLLDEPTNDLDFEGLERLERFLAAHTGALVLVSHDRELLDRTIKGIVEVEPASRGVRVWPGTWSGYAAARDAERKAASARYEQALARRRELGALLAAARTEARGMGGRLGKRTGGADRRPTHGLQSKVRQFERLLERTELPEKSFEPWELRLSLDVGARLGDVVVTLEQAIAVRGAFRLGPVSLDLVPGERLSITGRNGAGKTTLVGVLLGEIPLVGGRRVVGRRTAIGTLAQDRAEYAGDESLIALFRSRTALGEEPARTVLAKFGLAADHIGRPARMLSPGERTRVKLAELQVRKVNLLVLDEPTNHLDLEAVEQLEQALVSFQGTLVVVSHDRRFLEAIDPTRELRL